MRVRIEALTTAELDVAEAAARRVFELGEGSPDYRNRQRRQGAERTPGQRRYFNDVTVRPDVDMIERLGRYVDVRALAAALTAAIASRDWAVAEALRSLVEANVRVMPAEIVRCTERDEHPPHAPCTGREASGSHRFVAGDHPWCAYVVGIGGAMCGAEAGDRVHEGWGTWTR